MRDLQNDYVNGAYNNYVGYNEKIGYNQKIERGQINGYYVYNIMTFTKECNSEGTCTVVSMSKMSVNGELSNIIYGGPGAVSISLTESEVEKYIAENPLGPFIKEYPDGTIEEIYPDGTKIVGKPEIEEFESEFESEIEESEIVVETPASNNTPLPNGNEVYENEITWYDLDINSYKEHFLGDACFVAITYSNNSNGYDIKRNLPVYPEDVTFNASTNYASADIIGRPGTISGYINTTDITTQFSLHLHRELKTYTDDDLLKYDKRSLNIINAYGETYLIDKNGVDEIVALIQAAQYPKRYVDGISVPIVTYKFGDTLITGKQMSFSTKWSGPKINNIYMDCTISISVSHTPNGIIYFNDVAGIPYGEEMSGGTLLSGYNGNPRQFG